MPDKLHNFGWTSDAIFFVRCRACGDLQLFPEFEVSFGGYQEYRRHLTKLGWVERTDDLRFECPSCVTGNNQGALL